MCNFFSLVSKGDGEPMYFDWPLRQKCISGELDYNPDSHTSIADYYGFKGAEEDKLNKYEFNPLTKKFVVDQINTTDDQDSIERFCMTLDFKTIIPSLIITPIILPLEQFDIKKINIDDVVLLKNWDSVRDSVRDSVWAYISSFFIIEKWKYIEHIENVNPFQSCVDLWEKGIVHLMMGKNGDSMVVAGR
jgi:hypothetical protein